MASLSRTATTPTVGVLAAGGSTMVHALVHHQPAPLAPPPALADVVDPVHDVDGRVRDWRMNLPKLLGQRAESVHDIRHEFVKWRSGFVTESLLGDVATVRAFLQWADPVTDISALRVLGLGAARIDQKTAPRVAWSSDRSELPPGPAPAGRRCRSRGRPTAGRRAPSPRRRAGSR